MSESPIENEEINETRALSRLGLTDAEIRAYFSVAGKGVCLAAEIGKNAGVLDGDYEGALRVANNLIKAGLLMEIPGRTIRYQAIPPYAAMLRQLEDFRGTITDLRKTVPSDLQKEFDEFEEGFRKVSGLEDFKQFIVSIEQDIPTAMLDKFTGFAEKFKSFKQLEEFKVYVEKMRESAPQEFVSGFGELVNHCRRYFYLFTKIK